MDPQACAAFGRIRLFLSDLQLVLGGLPNSPFYGYGPMPALRGKPTRRSRAWMTKRRAAPRQQGQTAMSFTSTSCAAPKPRPTQIQMTQDSALQACPGSHLIPSPRYNLKLDDKQNDIVSSEQSHNEAKSEVEVDVGPHNQTLFGFPPMLVPTQFPVIEAAKSFSKQADIQHGAGQTQQSNYHNPNSEDTTTGPTAAMSGPCSLDPSLPFQSDGLEPDDRQNAAISDEQSQSKAKTDIGPHLFLSNSEPNQAETRSDLVIDPSLAAHEPSQPQPISFPFPVPIAPTDFLFFPVPPFYFHYPYPPPPFQYQQPLPPDPHSPDVQPTHPHPQSPEVLDNNSEPDHQTSFSDYNGNNFEHDYPEHHHEDNNSDHFEQHNSNSTDHFDDPNNQFDDQQYDCRDDDGGGDTFEYEDEDYNNYDYYDD